MIAPRWSKVYRDLLDRPARSLLAILAMAAGVLEIGAMLYKYAVLQPELTGMYGRTTPASATLLTDAADDAVVDSVRRVPGVARAEARPVVLARVSVGADEWLPAVLYVVRDFDHQQMDTFRPEKGAWPPAEGEVLLERTALQVAGVAIGDSLRVRLPGRDDLRVRVGGTAYAAGLAPAWMEHMVPGFVSWNSAVRGGDGESAQIRILVADHPLDEGHIREVADSVRAMLERNGHNVARVTVPPPGRHPHADQMEAFLFLLLGFGVLSFLLSTVLVASMIHALMSEQVRQIGILKAIGATDRQIAGIYLAQVALLAGVALAIGIPGGVVVGRAYAGFAAGILNANIAGRPFPIGMIAAEVVLGVLVPVLVALVPISRASRITVREALNDTGTGSGFGSRGIERRLMRLPRLSRPLALSLRTALQRRARLLLTVGNLAIGGAAFLSALNVAAAWTGSVDRDISARHYDLTVSLGRFHPIPEIEAALRGVPEVDRAEYWPGASPYLIGASGVPGSTVAVVGPTAGSGFLRLPLRSGRWLTGTDPEGVVLNQAVVARNPELAVGGRVGLRYEGRDVSFPIIGVVKELAPMPVIYAPAGAVLAMTGRAPDQSRLVRLALREHGDAAQRAAAQRVERAFAGAGIEVNGLQRMEDVRRSILDHLVIILAILGMASTIVLVVGALALASTLGLNVVQRTREIGILGAIGARPRSIAFQIWCESVLIGLLSWAVAVLLAVPISAGLEIACGNIFFKAPLDFYFSPAAAAQWLGLVLVTASACSLYPAWRATRMTIREALGYA